MSCGIDGGCVGMLLRMPSKITLPVVAGDAPFFVMCLFPFLFFPFVSSSFTLRSSFDPAPSGGSSAQRTSISCWARPLSSNQLYRIYWNIVKAWCTLQLWRAAIIGIGVSIDITSYCIAAFRGRQDLWNDSNDFFSGTRKCTIRHGTTTFANIKGWQAILIYVTVVCPHEPLVTYEKSSNSQGSSPRLAAWRPSEALCLYRRKHCLPSSSTLAWK
jgi:hypothetical protein